MIPNPKQRIVTEGNNTRYHPIAGGNQHYNNPEERYDFDERESKMLAEGKQVDQYYSFQPSKDMNISRSYDANDTQELPLRLNLNIHDNQASPTGTQFNAHM